MNSNALITLGHVVSSFLNERGSYSKDNYRRYLQIVAEGYTDLNIFNLTRIEVLKTTVNAANVVKLPTDYIDYVKIGVLVDGQVYELGRNDNVEIPTSYASGIEVVDSDNLDDVDVNWHTNYTVGGGKTFGEYRVDKAKRIIAFNGSLSNYDIIIEYASSGVSMSEKTYIPRECLGVLKDYLDWTIKKRSDEVSETKIQSAERRYTLSLKKLLELEYSLTYNELLDAIRSGYSQGAKR